MWFLGFQYISRELHFLQRVARRSLVWLRELQNLCCALPFFCRHSDKNPLFNRHSPQASATTSAQQGLSHKQAQETAGTWGRAGVPACRRGCRELQRATPSNSTGLQETADAGTTQTDVGGIPGRRGTWPCLVAYRVAQPQYKHHLSHASLWGVGFLFKFGATPPCQQKMCYYDTPGWALHCWRYKCIKARSSHLTRNTDANSRN